MDEDEAALGGQGVGVGGGFGQGFAVQHHGGAPGPGADHLGGRGEQRHDDDGADPEQAGVPGDGLGVVAGGHGDDAGAALLGRQQGEAVGGAAFLEGADGLQVLELERHVRARGLADRVGADGGRSEDPASDTCRGGFDVTETERRRSGLDPLPPGEGQQVSQT